MPVKLDDLRHHAIAASLFPETSLRRAIAKLGFVQADPIRAPARAQDLILRHRVRDYQVGDLDRRYRALRLEEDFLYAYGFMPVGTWQLLHPRTPRDLSSLETRVLEIVSRRARLHPRHLEQHLGREREVNAWGSYSKATTRSLERLHYQGLIRIAGRSGGVKLYEPAAMTHEPLSSEERLRHLVLLIARILAPVPETSLKATLRHLGRAAPNLGGRRTAVKALIKSGDLDTAEVDGVRYVWPAGRLVRTKPGMTVRFLAPFDPLVWDRRRFEHFWGWPYRFEAYTPPAKRKLGYYALPLLWGADVVGWVNVFGTGDDIRIESGFASGQQPSGPGFRTAFEEECHRLIKFLARPATG